MHQVQDKGTYQQRLPKRISAPIVGSDTSTSARLKDPNITLVGDVNEVEIHVDKKPVNALLDTGSCVSIVSESFHKEHLGDVEIKSVGNILNIECADGQDLPYIGYIETEISIDKGLPGAKPLPCLLLVTPDTQYSKKTPVILGTNVLNELMKDCKNNFGEQFLQQAKLHTPWYLSFRTITIRNRELRKNNHRLAIIRCAADRKIIIHPNQSLEIAGYTDKEMSYPSSTALIHETEDSHLPSSIDVTPAVVQYTYGKNTDIKVNLSNLTTSPVVIQPRAILCELQQVTVADEVFDKIEDNDRHEDVINSLNIDEAGLLDADQKEELVALLKNHKDIFSVSDIDIGICNKIKHRIDLMTDIPFKQRHRRIPPSMIEEVRQHIEQLLAAGVIRPSKSPYTSNVVLVRKKNGKLRLCVDYRQLNSITVKDSFALPRMEEIFDCLHGAKYFTTIDMKAGYHQIEVEEAHKERTAFTVGSIGFYEYNKMPFGLTNSPATYQRIMQEILGDLNMKICLIYLDDLIIFSDTFEQHKERLDLILTTLKNANLKLAPEKCCFFKPRVSFLGHVVSGNGIETDPTKIEKVQNWPEPSNPDELRSFLAFAGYYRRFIKDYSKIIKPLSELLPPTSAKKNQKKRTVEWRWTDTEQEIFDKIKELLSSPPVLAYPDFTLPFEVHTDASAKALGAVLYQMQEGKKRVIAFASRALNKAEQKYSAYKLEFLALKWAITEKFSDYLAVNHFTVLTDNNPLTHILSTAKLDATGQRWASALGQYSFDIYYRPGLKNADADGMSRFPYKTIKDESNSEMVKIEDNSVKAICNLTIPAYIETLPSARINLSDIIEEKGQPIAQKELREIRRAQREDKLIDRWRIAVIDKKIPNTTISKDDLIMRKQYWSFTLKRGILYRTLKEDDQEINQLVVPTSYRNEILQSLHNECGHPGKERTTRLVRDRFYWPGVGKDVAAWVDECNRCLLRKSTTDRAPLVSVQSYFPLDLVCIDYLTLEPSKGNIGNILIVTDHYTKFARAIPTKNQTARTTAEALFNDFIVHFGIPNRIHSDQGPNFESRTISELCRIMGIKKSHTTPYHPEGNAGPERFNRTLLNMLGTLEADQKHDWRKYINSLVYYYNCTPSETTRYSPYELLFGRKPKLPIDSAFEQVLENTDKAATDYLEELQERLEKTHQVVQKHREKAQTKQEKYYNKKAKTVKITVGDKVLVKRLAFDGKHKIADKFESEPYYVIEQPRPDIPVFKLRSYESNKERTLHQNHLLLIDDQDSEESYEDDEGEDVPVYENELDENVDASNKQGNEKSDITYVIEESDSENDCGYVPRTYHYGDAHRDESENTDSRSEDRQIEAENDQMSEQVSGEESNNEDVVHVQNNNSHSLFQENGQNTTVASEQVVSDERTQERTTEEQKVEDEMEPVSTVHREESTTPKPIPAPRRSAREKKLPQRYDQYIMYRLASREVDNRFHALDVLAKSGVLSEMDADTAHRLISAFMN